MESATPDQNKAYSWGHLAMAGFAGAGLALAYPDYGLWPLAWLTLAPFLASLWGKLPHQGARLGFVFGIFYFGPTLTWLYNTMTNFGHMPAWLAVAANGLGVVYMSFFTAFFGWLVAWAGRRAGDEMALAFAPFFWVAVELLRSHIPPLAFPWARIADSQYLFIHFIQIADICGEEGAGFIMLLANAALAALILWAMGHRRRFPLGWVAVCAVLAPSIFLYGKASLARDYAAGAKPIPVALIQGNIDQARKWEHEYQREQARMYLAMTMEASAAGAKLAIWPETAATFYFGKDPYYDGLVREVASVSKLSLFFGAVDWGVVEGKEVAFNSAWLLTPDGEAQKYDKVRLAPFGEYVPLPRLLFFVHKIAHSIGDITPGEAPVNLDVGTYKIGPQICFEIIFPQYSAKLAAMGAGAIVNITNDSWFGFSPASRQSLSMAVFRAVENRIPLLRGAQSGVSAIIGPDGRISAETPLFVKTTLHGSFVPRQGPPTIYSLYCLPTAGFFVLASAGLLIWAYALGKRARPED